jgi:hypothetical protein
LSALVDQKRLVPVSSLLCLFLIEPVIEGKDHPPGLPPLEYRFFLVVGQVDFRAPLSGIEAAILNLKITPI